MTLKSRRTAIRDAITARLSAVTGVENVYNEYQIAQDEVDFIAKFRQSNQTRLQTWAVRRVRTDPHTNEMDPDVTIRCTINWYHTFEIELWYGMQVGQTDAEFQDLIDDVLDSFKDQRTLGGWQVDQPLHPVQDFSTAYLMNVFAHFAKFAITVIDIEDGVTPV